MVNGVNDPNAWTIVSRHGEYSQSESECNVPGAVSVARGALTIKTTAVSATCGDFDPVSGARCSGLGSPCPGTFSYTTGDVQWNRFSFKYGVVVFRARFPVYQTVTWPAIWMLGTNCQNSNKYTGDTGKNGCPNVGQSGYYEVDNAEFYAGSAGWGRFYVANPSFSGGPYATAPVDGNYHVFGTVWTATGLAQYMDDRLEASTSQTVNASLFLIMQIQTGGVGGSPVNSLLPAYLNVDYVKVCNSKYSLSQCENAAASDPNVIFWDDFGGPAQ
jgi:beta-glucanase (GH16 family)